MTPQFDAALLLPEIIVTSTLVAVFVFDLFVSEKHRAYVTCIGGVGVLAALFATIGLGVDDQTGSMANGTYVVDTFSLLAKGIFLASAFVVFLLGASKEWKGEYITLILASVLGMVVISSARDLILFFVAFELLAIPGYLLAGWQKKSAHGHEAALKYYLLGVIATAVMLYGLSLIFGVANGTSFEAVANSLSSGEDDIALVRLAIFFVVAGMAFKIAAVPFHFWAPDVYEGAPVPVAAFLAVASKAAGFVALLVLLLLAFPDAASVWAPVLYGLAIATMTLGNVVALRQRNVMRLLAYSSIAQAGYLLIPLAVTTQYGGTPALALESTMEFLIIYAAMSLGAFAVAKAVVDRKGSADILGFRGLFHSAPGLAAVFTVFLLSLGGIPPFGGWFAKLVIFRSAIEADTTPAIVLAVIAAINTAIGLFYYAAVVRQLWLEPTNEDDAQTFRLKPNLIIALGLTAAVVVVTGVLPGLVTDLGTWPTLAL